MTDAEEQAAESSANPAPIFRYRVVDQKVSVGDVTIHPLGEALLTEAQFEALESKTPGNLVYLGI